MLIKDVLQVIFSYFNSIEAKICRLVCKKWNSLLHKRFEVFYANVYLKTVPSQCSILICGKQKLPQMHPNIKKALLYYTDIIWDQDIDTLYIYTDYTGNVSITGNVRNLIIGVYVHNYTNWSVFKHIDIDNLIVGNIIHCVYWTICLTSETNYDDPTRQWVDGKRVIYIKSGTSIDTLIIGVSCLHIVKLDAKINTLRIVGNYKYGTLFNVYKDGIKKVYDLTKFPNSILDKSVYS